MLNLPNAITLFRLGLVPVIVYLLWKGQYGAALVAFLTAAISDFLDGVLARRLNMTSELGARLDPIADKLNMIGAAVVLAWNAQLPLWLAGAIILRDVVIVSGAAAYRYRVGHVEIAPTMLSKVNTFAEFGVLLLVMLHAARWMDVAHVLQPLFVLVFATVLASGAQYVWVWSRKAARSGGAFGDPRA